jgi:hypothetical protein
MPERKIDLPFVVSSPEQTRKSGEIAETINPLSRPLFDELARLEEEVAKMEMPSRFNPDKKIGPTEVGHHVSPTFENLTEPEFKRQELKLKIHSLRQDLIFLQAKLEDLEMEVHVTGQEM